MRRKTTVLIIALLAAVAILCSSCTSLLRLPVSPEATEAAASESPAPEITPEPTGEPEDTLPYRVYYDGEMSDPPEGGLTVDEAVQRLHEKARPHDGLGAGVVPAYRYEGIVEVDPSGECYLFAFGEDSEERFTVTARYAVGVDGAIYEYDVVTDGYKQLFGASVDLSGDASGGAPAAVDPAAMTVKREDGRINVYDADGALYQSFEFEGDDYLGADFVPERIDVNFDGAPDIQMLYSMGAANAFYTHWLWDADALRFEPFDGLEDCPNLQFDERTGVVESYVHISAMEGVILRFDWADGELRRIYQETREYDWDHDLFTLVIEELQPDGTMKTTEEGPLTAEDIQERDR